MKQPTVTISDGYSGIVLSWINITGAEYYQIFRKTEGEDYTLIATTSDSVWIEPDSPGDTVFTYQVAARMGDNSSALSNEVSNTVHYISDCDISLKTDSYTYDGTAKQPAVTIKDGFWILTEDKDYTVSYSENTNAGTAAVTIEGCGNYAGTAEREFVILKADQNISLSVTSHNLGIGDTAVVSASAKGMLTYASSDPDVAAVSSDGVITAIGEGSAVITVTASATDNYNEASGTVSVTVKSDSDSSGDAGKTDTGNTESGDAGSGNTGEDDNTGNTGSDTGSSSENAGDADTGDTGESSGKGTDIGTGESGGDSSGHSNTETEDDDSNSGNTDKVISAGDTLVVQRGTTFYFNYNLKGGNADLIVTLKNMKSGDEVLVGDWDGDGIDTICYREGNRYYYQSSPSDTRCKSYFDYGKKTDEVLAGDWDGDGVDTLAVHRDSNHYIIQEKSGDTQGTDIHYGKKTDTVLVGKWPGNASGEKAVIDTLAVRRDNTYFISNTLKTGNADYTADFGRTTDNVFVGDWDGDGYDTLMIRRGNRCYVSNVIKTGYAEIEFDYGKATDAVYSGKWK